MCDDGLPEEIIMCDGDEQFDLLFAKTTVGFFCNDSDFIHHFIVGQKYPKWMERNRKCISQPLGEFQVILKKGTKPESCGMRVDVHFFRRPQDDAIAAVVIPSGMFFHYNLIREKSQKLFPKDIEFYTLGSFISKKFERWALEKVDTRASRIKSILS